MKLLSPSALSSVNLFLQAMQDDLVCGFTLAICLRMGHYGELSLTPQGVEVIGDLCHVEMPHIVEDHCSRSAKAGTTKNNLYAHTYLTTLKEV